MSAPVDVLAVEYLRELAGDYKRVGHDKTAAEIDAQAAAAAELVEAAALVANYQSSGDAVAELPTRAAQFRRLRAALAKFGGAA